MKKSYFNIYLVFLTLSLQLCVNAQTEGTKPNIILIFADDLGYTDVGFNRDGSYPAEYGAIPTPEIDALATNGVVAKNAHVAHPFCGPSRAALMTGMYPHRIGTQYNLPNSTETLEGIPLNEKYFSKVLQENSYNTAAIGKWHLGVDTQFKPNNRGFDYFFGMLGGGHQYFESDYESQFYNSGGTVTNEYRVPLLRNSTYVTPGEFDNDEYLTDILTEEAVNYINTNAADTDPFFMYLAYNAPHTPLQAPAAKITAFNNANGDGTMGSTFSTVVAASPDILNANVPGSWTGTEQQYRDSLVEDRLIYATMVSIMDEGVGLVKDALVANNILENTLIIFMSDNGGKRFQAGAVNIPLQEGKGSVNEGGHRVPMLLHWPDQISGGQTYNKLISSLDLYPTFVNLAGASLPANKQIDGTTIIDAIITNSSARVDESLYIMRPQNGFHNGAILTDDYKLIKKGGGGSTWALYDAVNDPGEATNLRTSTDVLGTGLAGVDIIDDLLDNSIVWVSDFQDVQPQWYDNDGDGSGHPHSFLWNDNTLPAYDVLFERSLLNVGLPLSDQQNTGNWVLNTDISDEFEAPTLNENQWLIQGREDENGVPEYQSNFKGRAPSQFSTDNAILEDGKLKILTKWEPSYNFNPTQDANGDAYENITTAAVISKNQFQYGYMEIKSKAADAEITSSFWTTGNQSELDMFEMFGGHKTNIAWKKRLKFNMISWDPNNPYYTTNGPAHTRNIQADNNTADDFHVYGFEWTAEYIKVYIDGVLHPDGTILKSVITNNGAEPDRWVTDVPYWVWFDSETFPWLGLPEASDLLTPAEYQIEYIRVWQKQPNVITITGTTDAVESQSDGVFTVSLPEGIDATEDIVIDYAVSGEAIEGTDFTTLSGSVTISSGTNSTDIILIANEDGLAEISETVIIELTSSTTESIDPTPAEINILDISLPTTLTAGDVAIVGYKADAGNVGELAFIILKDINPGTSISLSNRSWKSDGSFNTGSGGTPYAIDDVFSWTTTGTHRAGTVFKLGSDGIVTTVINGIETSVGSTTQTFGTDGDWDLSPVGDSVLMYNGNSSTHPDNNSNLWITGLNTNGVENTSIQAAGWSIGGGNAYCQLPATLDGFDIDVTGGDIANPYDQNFGVYVGNASGDAAVLRTSINDYTKWNLNEATGAYYLWKSDFTVGGNTGEIMVLPAITTAQTGFWDDTTTWVGGVVPAATSPVIIAHTVTINSDVECASMLINDTVSTFVSVGAGNSLTVNGDVTTSNDIFLLSNSSSFSSLIVNGTINGQIAYNRFISASPTNDLISPPVTGLTFGTFATVGANSQLSENPSNTIEKAFAPFVNADGDYVNYLIESTLNANDNNHPTVLIQGKGYRTATNSGSSLRFKNTSTTSDVSIALTDETGSNAFGAWNLIGNPYPSYINFSSFFSANSAQFDAGAFNAVYGYNGAATGNKWEVYNGLNLPQDGKITPGQGFFVKSKSGGSTTDVTFTTAMRTTGTGDDFIANRGTASKNSNTTLAKLQLSNATDIFSTDVYFVENQTRGLDPGYDAGAYLGNSGGIFTHLVEENTGIEMAIQALPINDYNDVVVPLGVKSDAGVQITIGLDAATVSIPSDIYIYLEDKETETWTLLNTGNYEFTPTAAISGVDRFSVHFRGVALSVEDNDVLKELNIYTDQSSKTLVVKGQVTNKSKVNLYDLQGRLVLNENLDQNTNSNIIDVSKLSTGIYVVKVDSGGNIKTQKVIIN